MKKISKLLALVMCLTLMVCSLAGCAKSEEDVIKNSVSKINDAKNFEMEATMGGKMTISVADTSQDTDMNMKMNVVSFQDPLKAKTSATVTSAGVSTTTESYMQKEGKDLVVYTKADNQWTKTKMENAVDIMQSSGDMSKQLSEDSSKYTKKEDQTENDKTYMIYEYTVSAKDNQEMMENLMSSMTGGLGALMQEKEVKELLDTIIQNMGDIKMTIWFDSEEETIYKITYSMTDMMNKVLDAIISKMKQSASSNKDDDSVDLSSALADAKITVKDMNMTCIYKNVDTAADFEIPKEALAAKE
ncbi:MAG: DUF6612 family protein [Eubacterium sp.]